MTTIFTASGDVLYEAPVTKSAIIKHVLMGDYYIELSFNAVDYIDFHKGCYIEYNSRKFEILSNIYPESGSNGGVKYTVRFEAQQNHMKNCKVFWLADENKETTFHNTTDLASFGNLIVDNVNRYLGVDSWELGGVPSDLEEQTKLVSFNGDWCWDALNTIAETFDVEWWTIEDGGSVRLFFGKMELGTEEDFVEGDVVTSIPPKRGDDSNYGTRFYVFGSTRNLSSSYAETEQGGTVNHVSEPRLHLPEGKEYIDAWEGLSPNDVVEQVVFFEDIFPKNTETITEIETVEREIVEGEINTAYVMYCEDTPFTVENMIEGETLGCQFTSGSLMGREFELQINKDNFDKRFEIVAQTESYGDQVLIIPNENLHPEAGDTFILTGVELPEERIKEAEEELLKAGTSWALKNSQDTDVYDCPTNPVFCRENEKNYDLGQKVRLIGHRFGGGRSSRIQGYEKKLYDEYQAVYTVGDNTAYSRLGNIEKSVQNSAYAERIGVSSGVGVYIIRSKYDSTVPTDYNVYSALASEVLFLNKRKGGVVNADVTFNKDVLVGGKLATKDFSQGNVFGSGAALYRDVYGNTVGELDKLIVRQEAYFNELVINQTTFVLGETVFTMAGCEIERVERYSSYYRCHYDNKDGNRMSGFVVGDQARCQRFDPSYKTVVKYYWRLVVGVGDDYVDLSITDCDGSGIPDVGDEIVHLGNRTNLNRQHAIVIVSTPTPSILQYSGINSYYMPAPITKIAPNDNLFKGKVQITGGSGAGNLDDLNDTVDGIVQKAIGDITFPEIPELDGEQFGNANLLRNSGFNGAYLDKLINQANDLPYEGELIEPTLEYWYDANSNDDVKPNSQTAKVSEDSASASGVIVNIYSGEGIKQTLVAPIVQGDSYVLSFKAKSANQGKIKFSVGGYEKKNIQLSKNYDRYIEKFTASTSDKVFKIQAENYTCQICEIQLERGTVASAWNYSIWDNTSAVAYYKALRYLSDAIVNGTTTIAGGLILTNLLALCDYNEDGEVEKVTAGINGIDDEGTRLAFWAGGDLGQAVTTVDRFTRNPQYQPTDAEWEQMAKLAVTHGGDVFLRGYINALGGYFRGTVDIANQKILLDSDGSGHFANGNVRWDSYGRVTKSAPDSIAWTRVDSYADVNEYNGGVVEIDFSKGSYLKLAFNSMNYDPGKYPDTYSLETPAEGYTIAICNDEWDGGSAQAYLTGTFYYYENGVKKTADKITFGTSKYFKFLTAELVFNAVKGWEVRTDHKCTITSKVLYIDPLDGEADEDNSDFCTGDYDFLDGDGQRVTLRIENGRIKEVR